MSGFDVVRAVKNVRDHHGSAPPPPRPPRAPPEKPPDPPDDGKPGPSIKIGKTAVPSKNEFVCYECGYRFTIAGKVRTLYCAKCRTILNQTDYTIDKPHDISIVTAGAVRITAEGTWAGGSLSARDVVLEGKHAGGSIKAFRRLEIAPGAEFNLANIQAEDLLIRAGAEVRADVPAKFRDIDVAGEFDGELEATGLITVHAGGHLKGKVVSKRLKVEEGGGLTAEVEIRPD
ncbi:MAG TPA: polymer-forming cytoskeletal protein [Kiritimatiellia bacterium]|nr:polymer-forming cytoskeletal protein [Kiritimatiellia bacterium]HMP98011.1 polymer-forming cytoskeletal protein [Kiritimatiellia bacterium]